MMPIIKPIICRNQ